MTRERGRSDVAEQGKAPGVLPGAAGQRAAAAAPRRHGAAGREGGSGAGGPEGGAEGQGGGECLAGGPGERRRGPARCVVRRPGVAHYRVAAGGRLPPPGSPRVEETT